MRELELRRAVAADLDDAASWSVYLDWLLERGDPRGEFIALQLIAAREPDGPQAARAAELWQVHGPRWSAEFAELGAQVEFRRGFCWRVAYRGIWPDELVALVRDRPTLERAEGPMVPDPVRDVLAR